MKIVDVDGEICCGMLSHVLSVVPIRIGTSAIRTCGAVLKNVPCGCDASSSTTSEASDGNLFSF